MPDYLKNSPASDILKTLAHFLHEPDTENLPCAEIRAQLKQSAFDVNRVKMDFRDALDKAKGRARLIEARTKRSPLLARFTELREKLASVSDVKAAARQIFNDVFGATPQAEMFCRKFEELSEDDARTLIEDSALLEEMENDDPDAKA